MQNKKKKTNEMTVNKLITHILPKCSMYNIYVKKQTTKLDYLMLYNSTMHLFFQYKRIKFYFAYINIHVCNDTIRGKENQVYLL